MSDTLTQHDINIVFQNPWQEWVARCYCGWVGSLHPYKEDARTQARQHLINVGVLVEPATRQE